MKRQEILSLIPVPKYLKHLSAFSPEQIHKLLPVKVSFEKL